MTTCFVTGIAPTNDVAELEKMFAIDGLDRSKLIVITKADRTDEHDSSFLNFIHAGGPHIDGDAVGTLSGTRSSIMTGSGGTVVPGIGAATNSLAYWGVSHGEQHVGLLPIPADEADNYNDALDNGRAVVGYQCAEDPTNIEAALRTAGVRKVKTFTAP